MGTHSKLPVIAKKRGKATFSEGAALSLLSCGGEGTVVTPRQVRGGRGSSCAHPVARDYSFHFQPRAAQRSGGLCSLYSLHFVWMCGYEKVPTV